jgi:DNA replication protein DnaC
MSMIYFHWLIKSWLIDGRVMGGKDGLRKDEAETSVLFELVMHCYERWSLLVTSNQPFSEWEKVFSTSAMTVAAVDRLVDHSTLIQINGHSYRRKRARRVGGLTKS